MDYSGNESNVTSSDETSWHDQDIIPEDEYQTDGDSAFYSGSDFSTMSLPESVHNFFYENGRSYHAYREGIYPLPNDEQECMRLELFHGLFRMRLDDELFLAPLSNPRKILDIGTGTGAWVMDIAEQFPDAEPTYTWPNVRFELDDVELEWTYEEKDFDFIHIRSMSGAIRDWEKLFEQSYTFLSPGGYIEFQDTSGRIFCDDHTMPQDSAFNRWFGYLQQGCEVSGRSLDIAPNVKRLLEQAGFVNIHQRLYKWPIGPWARDAKNKEIGKYSAILAIESLPAYGMGILTRFLGWSKQEVDRLVEECTEELRYGHPAIGGPMHIYSIGYFIYAQKPHPDEPVRPRRRER